MDLRIVDLPGDAGNPATASPGDPGLVRSVGGPRPGRRADERPGSGELPDQGSRRRRAGSARSRRPARGTRGDVVSNGTRRTAAGAATCRPRVGVAQGAGRSGGSRWAVPLEARGGGRRRGARRSSVVVRFGELVGGRVLGRGRPSTVVARALSAPRCRSPDTSPARGFPGTRDRARFTSGRPPLTQLAGGAHVSRRLPRPGTGTLRVARARRRDRGVLGSQHRRSHRGRGQVPDRDRLRRGDRHRGQPRRVAGLDRRLPGPPRAASSARRLRDRDTRNQLREPFAHVAIAPGVASQSIEAAERPGRVHLPGWVRTVIDRCPPSDPGSVSIEPPVDKNGSFAYHLSTQKCVPCLARGDPESLDR